MVINAFHSMFIFFSVNHPQSRGTKITSHWGSRIGFADVGHPARTSGSKEPFAVLLLPPFVDLDLIRVYYQMLAGMDMLSQFQTIPDDQCRHGNIESFRNGG